jgi:23S rRNA U2552 (ribose-2'-O)-methylase RlmE/FtsJ
MKTYNPIIEKLDVSDENILKTSLMPINFSSNIDYPKFTYGFQHFLHATKNKMEIFNDFKSKKKVYLVVNEFEKTIDDYEDSIEINAVAYFGLNDNKISTNLLKLWEILFYIDKGPYIPTDFFNFKANISALVIASDPSPFLMALKHYRNVHYPTYKTDKYTGFKFSKDTDSEEDKKFSIHNVNNISDIKTDTQADIIVIDVNHLFEVESSERNLREQLAFPSLVCAISKAISLQKKNGILICKFYETFCKTSVKLISVLANFYKNIYVCKPLISRNIKSERYLLCNGFTENKKDTNIVDQLCVAVYKNIKYTVDIFPSYILSERFIKSIIDINNKMSNHQYILINKMISFINSQNYFGEIYHNSRDEQIEANKFWINKFLT